MKKILFVAVRAALLALWTVAPAAADVADFYKGKRISFYVGYAPGGGYDQYSRIAARYIGKYIPGHPNITVFNKPGAGSLTLANELFNLLPRDGTAVGMFNSSLHLWALLGQDNIRFTATQFNWIGRITDSDDVMAVRPNAGVKVFEDAKQKELAIGVPGATSSPALIVGALNWVFGTKFKLVSGYPGSAEIRLAVERGELDGNQSLLWSVDQDWVKRNNLIVLYKVFTGPILGLEKVPTLIDMAKTDEQKKLISFFSSYAEVGRSVAAPPGVPPDRVAALRAALARTVNDPGFLEEIKNADLRLAPMSGEKLQAIVASSFDLPDSLKKQARSFVNVAIPQ